MPFATGSFLLLVVMPGATSSVLAPSRSEEWNQSCDHHHPPSPTVPCVLALRFVIFVGNSLLGCGVLGGKAGHACEKRHGEAKHGGKLFTWMAKLCT